MEIFRMFGSILLQGGKETEEQLDNIDNKGKSVGSKLASIGNTALKAGTAIVGGISAGGAAVLKFAEKTSDAASRINDLSEKIGISKTAFQEWDYITGQVGANVEGLQMGIKTLSSAAYEAAKGTASYAEAFDALGLSVTNADGSLKDQETLLNETIAALSQVEDKTTRTALATDLLGRSATDLAPVLNMGAEEIEKMRKKAHDLGIVLSDEAITAGDDFGDALDTLKATASSLITGALAPLLPILTGLMERLVELLPPVMDIIKPLMDKLVPVISRLLETLLPPMIKLLDSLMPLLSPLLDLLVLIVDSAMMPLIEFLVQILDAIMPPLIQIIEALMPLLKPIMELLGRLLDVVMPLFIKIFNKVTDTVLANFKDQLEELKPVFEAVMKGIGHLMDFWLKVFTGDWKGAWDSLKEYFTEVWNAVAAIFKAVSNNLIRGLNGLIRGLNQISFSVPDWVPVIGGKSYGMSIKEIPLLASGGDIQRSGAAIVGEAGPELLELPKGARVTPLDKSGNIEVHLHYPMLLNRQAINTIGEQLVSVIKGKTSLRTV